MNSSLWYFPIAALINAVASTVFSFYLLFENFKNRTARFLIYFCVSVALWSYCYFLWQISKDAESALFWSRALMIGAIFTSISYFHLVLVFLGVDKLKFYKIVLGVFYFFSLMWVVIDFTPYFVSHVESLSYFKFWPIAGSLYFLFLIAFFTHVAYASILLFRKYKMSEGSERVQTVLLLIGILVAFIGGSTNYPLWYRINFPPWGNCLVGVYVVLTVYAIMKYRFLDIKTIFAELFTGILIIVFAIDAFVSKSNSELLFRLSALVVMAAFGVVLIRSVRKEILRREEVISLAHSLEKANLRLQELDRQKTEFLSIASHQLRTPLSILKGYIELLTDGAYGKPSKKMKQTLTNMDESNERLVKLVDEFLDITRIEQGRTKFTFKDNDINLVIEDVIKEIHQRAEDKGLKIAWEKKRLPMIKMDDEKIRNVVFNFVDNAIKYSIKGTIRIESEKEEAGIKITVKDSGIGFDKKDEVNFYQKFYRGENVQGTNVNGTGLGLYVCRKFIETHGGQVEAHSKGLNKGGEFSFWIPLIPPPQPENFINNNPTDVNLPVQKDISKP